MGRSHAASRPRAVIQSASAHSWPGGEAMMLAVPGGASEALAMGSAFNIGRLSDGDQLVLVTGARHQTGNEQLPYPRRAEGAHLIDPAVPEVPVADHPDRFGVGRPNGKGGPGDALVDSRMGAEHLPQLAVPALAEQVQVELADGGPGPVGIVKDKRGRPAGLSVVGFQAIPTGTRRHGGFEDAGRVDPRHLDLLGGVVGAEAHPRRDGVGPVGPHHRAVQSEQAVGIGVFAGHELLELAGRHRVRSGLGGGSFGFGDRCGFAPTTFCHRSGPTQPGR